LADLDIRVAELIGENAITREDGNEIFSRIHPALQRGEEVCLDFGGVRIFVSPFLNAAIGQLYKDVDWNALRHLLRIKNLTPAGRSTLRVVIETAKKAYGSPGEADRMERAVDEELAAGL
jgi:hypothetical protein